MQELSLRKSSILKGREAAIDNMSWNEGDKIPFVGASKFNSYYRQMQQKQMVSSRKKLF